MPGTLSSTPVDLDSLAGQVRRARGHLTDCLALIPIIRCHFRDYVQPTPEDSPATISLSRQILIAVQYALETSKTHHGIVSSIMQDWPSIWSWSSFLIRHHLDTPSSSHKPATQALSNFASTIMVLLANGDAYTRRRILQTPEVIGTVVGLWLESVENGLVVEELSMIMTHVADHLHLHVKHSSPKIWDSALPNMEVTIVNTILRHIVAVLPMKPLNHHLLHGPLKLFDFCTRTFESADRSALARHSISTLVDVIEVLTSDSTEMQGRPFGGFSYPYYASEWTPRQITAVREMLELCANCIERCIAQDGFGWAVDVLEVPQQFLPALFRTSALVGSRPGWEGQPGNFGTTKSAYLPGSLSLAYAQLLDTITANFECLEVLFRSAAALEYVENAELEDAYLQGASSHAKRPVDEDPFALSWHSFKSRNKRLLQVMEEYATKPRNVCCNSLCTSPGVKAPDTKYCSQCLLTVYCSIECHQVHQDVGGHGTCCENYMAELRDGYPRFMSRADEDFQAFLKEEAREGWIYA